MAQLSIFWFGIAALFSCALMFCVPVVWLSMASNQSAAYVRWLSAVLLSLMLALFTFGIYRHLGAGDRITEYYQPSTTQQLANQAEIRPLYARLQRELIKSKLNLNVANDNIDLILNFANLHAQVGEGVLPAEVQDLLLAVLKIQPQQVTALNLLAVNAYKMQRYPQAVAYWRTILQQFTPQMRNSAAERLLTAKIAETEARYIPLDRASKLKKHKNI